MKMIDPVFLRHVCDELKSGKLDKNNVSSVPAGVSSVFDQLFVSSKNSGIREKLLKMFSFLALFRGSLDISDVSRLTSLPIQD